MRSLKPLKETNTINDGMLVKTKGIKKATTNGVAFLMLEKSVIFRRMVNGVFRDFNF